MITLIKAKKVVGGMQGPPEKVDFSPYKKLRSKIKEEINQLSAPDEGDVLPLNSKWRKRKSIKLKEKEADFNS